MANGTLLCSLIFCLLSARIHSQRVFEEDQISDDEDEDELGVAQNEDDELNGEFGSGSPIDTPGTSGGPPSAIVTKSGAAGVTTSPPSSSPSTGLSTAALAGIIAGVVILIVIIIILIVCLVKRSKQRRQETTGRPASLQHEHVLNQNGGNKKQLPNQV